MSEEFAAYGLPGWSLWAVGGLKILCAVSLLAGIRFPALVAPAAGMLLLLMLGAIGMHLKVRDPLLKSLPASLVLGLVAVLLAGAF